MLLEAAAGRFPAPNGAVDVLPSPPGPADAVVAFTARNVIAAPVARDDVLARLSPDDLGAPLSPAFLVWLSERLRSTPGVLDAVLVADRSRPVRRRWSAAAPPTTRASCGRDGTARTSSCTPATGECSFSAADWRAGSR
jgi:hypothetical protein